MNKFTKPTKDEFKELTRGREIRVKVTGTEFYARIYTASAISLHEMYSDRMVMEMHPGLAYIEIEAEK